MKLSYTTVGKFGKTSIESDDPIVGVEIVLESGGKIQLDENLEGTSLAIRSTTGRLLIEPDSANKVTVSVAPI